MGTSISMILVPPSIWSPWTRFCREWVRDFRSAAPASNRPSSSSSYDPVCAMMASPSLPAAHGDGIAASSTASTAGVKPGSRLQVLAPAHPIWSALP